MSAAVTRHYLVACDFDQTLSYNDSGLVLSELIGVPAFTQKVAGLAGIVPPEHIYGTEFDYDPSSGEICAIAKAPAGFGKVAIVEELEATLQTSPHRTVYVGDGNSDVHVMLHVNNRGGFTIAVSEAKYIARIARRTVVSESALSVLVPILEDVMGWDAVRIRELFESYGLIVQEWDKARTDWVTIREDPALIDPDPN